MLLQRQTVSRKTPGDGRLEVTAETAATVAPGGESFRLAALGEEAPASIHTLTCTCGKRGEGAHIHYFLESPVLRRLTPGEEVGVELKGGVVRIRAI